MHYHARDVWHERSLLQDLQIPNANCCMVLTPNMEVYAKDPKYNIGVRVPVGIALAPPGRGPTGCAHVWAGLCWRRAGSLASCSWCAPARAAAASHTAHVPCEADCTRCSVHARRRGGDAGERAA